MNSSHSLSQPRYWVGVASRNHVLQGVEAGICQLCHGKSNPLKRLTPGDWILYYSPRSAMNDGEMVQAFTAMGQILAGDPYPVERDGSVFYRRAVRFMSVQEAPIRPLIPELSFIKNKQSWGYVFRFGWLEIHQSDFQSIVAAMQPEEGFHEH